MTWKVVADTEAAYEFVNSMAPLHRTPHMKGLVQLHGGEIVAASVYDEYNGGNIFGHVAGRPGRKWLTRWFLHEAFKYPFVTLGCHRMTLWINSDNHDSIRFSEHLGFKREAVLKEAGPECQDVFLYVMFRKDCRYA